jgi:outer membrane lipoprotein carrier protein
MKLAVLVLALLVAPVLAAPQSATDVVDKLQKFYANVDHVSSDFTQTVQNAQFGNNQTSSGKVWLKKPGKMRWDYYEQKNNASRVKKSFISDGTTLFDVELDNKQVLKKSLQNNIMPVAVSFLLGKGNLKRDFDVQLDPNAGYGGKGDLVLELTPKQPSAQYKTLYIVVDPSEYSAKESIIIDSSNNVNHFVFSKRDVDKDVKDSSFKFDERSVPDFKIIDTNAPPPKPTHP